MYWFDVSSVIDLFHEVYYGVPEWKIVSIFNLASFGCGFEYTLFEIQVIFPKQYVEIKTDHISGFFD